MCHYQTVHLSVILLHHVMVIALNVRLISLNFIVFLVIQNINTLALVITFPVAPVPPVVENMLVAHVVTMNGIMRAEHVRSVAQIQVVAWGIFSTQI